MTKILTIILVDFVISVSAQVPNNSIWNRLILAVDEPTRISSTAGSSVEWDCINKSLTNKCLVYHNDQWFDFTVPVSGRYFINISAQQCREERGVQAIVIEGNPCVVKTYRIIRCINRIRQEDVFIQLDSLKTGISYLVNIDGFLGDFCDFKIQLATQPEGLPQMPPATELALPAVAQQTWQYSMNWSVGKDRIDDFEKFRVFRRQPSDVRYVLLKEQMIRRNAFGIPELVYSVFDSLSQEGIYTYEVYGIRRETFIPISLAVQEVALTKPKEPLPPPEQQRAVRIALYFTEKTSIMVLVYDRTTNKKVHASKQIFDPNKTVNIELDLSEALNSGVNQFLILVTDGKAKEATEFYYKYHNGRFIKE